MQKKEYEEFFEKLPRRELQSLCKKCGLPARKSTSHMVQSLLFYFQRKGYISSDEWISGNGESVLQPHASLNWNGNAIRGHADLSRCSRENGNTQQFQFSPQYAGSRGNHKEGNAILCGSLENAPQFCSRSVNAYSMVSSTRVPAFEFYASSEEGLNLCVDLSSSPSDWIKKCKDQVLLSENLSTTASCSLHHELGRMEDSNQQISVNPGEILVDVHVQNENSPSLAMEGKFHMGFPQSDEDNISRMSLPTYREELNVPRCSGKDKVLFLLEPNSDVQNLTTPNTVSDPKNRCNGTLDSDITDTPVEKTACNFCVNSSSDGSVDLIAVDHQNSTLQDSCNHENVSRALDHQNSKPDDEIYENSALQGSSNLENNSVLFVECLTNRSMEMELSDTDDHNKYSPCPPNKNKEFFDLVDLEHNVRTRQDALANSGVIGPSRNHVLSCSEEQELGNIVNRRESSMCSEVNNSSEKTCSKSDNFELNKGSQRKRLRVDSEGLSDCSNMKILRSMKHSVEVLPRRSTRLVSKIQVAFREFVLQLLHARCFRIRIIASSSSFFGEYLLCKILRNEGFFDESHEVFVSFLRLQRSQSHCMAL